MIDELTRARQIRDTDPKLLDRGIDGETLFPFCCKYQDNDGILSEMSFDDCPYSATRRAIVMVAAEIGRRAIAS